MKKHIVAIFLWTVKVAIATGFFYAVVPKYDFVGNINNCQITNRVTGQTRIINSYGEVAFSIDHTGKIRVTAGENLLSVDLRGRFRH